MFITVVCHAQLVVSDPTMAGLTLAQKATTVKQLEEAARQTIQLSKTYEQIKKGVELYEKVSNKLQDAEQVQDLFNKQTSLIIRAGDAIKSIGKMKNPSASAVSDYRRNINTVIDNNRANLTMLTNLLTDGFFKISDEGRLKLIMELKDRTERATRSINSYQSAYEATSGAKKLLQGL